MDCLVAYYQLGLFTRSMAFSDAQPRSIV